MMKSLGENDEIVLDNQDWKAIEEAGGVVLPTRLRQLVEDALARWIRCKSEVQPNLERVPSGLVRRALTPMSTRIGRLVRALAGSQELDLRCRKIFHCKVVAQGAAWGERCTTCPKEAFCFVLPRNAYYNELQYYLSDLTDVLSRVSLCDLIRETSRRSALQAAKDSRLLFEMFTPSSGTGGLVAAPIGSAFMVGGGGKDLARDAAIHSVWYHLRGLIQWKHCSQSDVVTVLSHLHDAVHTALGETVDGKRSCQRDFNREGFIAQCVLAYSQAGGDIRLFFQNDDKLNSSKFILFMCELNGIATDVGHPLGPSDKSIADATWKLIKDR
ncbi:MAG: hypothetical protein JXQ99_04535 [Hyphomicrobiaceae bacterium]